MKDTTFTAQGSYPNPMLYIPVIFVICLIPLATRLAVGMAGLEQHISIEVMIFNLFIVFFLMKKISPQWVSIHKEYKNEGIKVRGKFENGNVSPLNGLAVKSFSESSSGIEFIINEHGKDYVYTITDRHFSPQSLKLISEIASDLKTLPPDNLMQKYADNTPPLKIRDIQKLTAIRIDESPSYNKISLLCMVLVAVVSYFTQTHLG